jgi:hypothetical protein
LKLNDRRAVTNGGWLCGETVLKTLNPDEFCRCYFQTSCRARHLKDVHEISFFSLADGNRESDKVAPMPLRSGLGCNLAVAVVADLYNKGNLID